MIYRRRLTRAELRQRANHKMISGSWNDGEENEHETQLKNRKNTGRWITPILGTFVLTLFIFLLFWNLYHFFHPLFSVTKGTKFMSYKEKSNHD